MQKQALNDLLLSLVPDDGSAVGNQTLRDQFLKAAATAGFIAPGQLFEQLRDDLIKQGQLEKGKGRGGSVRRAAEQHGFDLDVKAVAAPVKPKAPAAPRVKADALADETANIISYRHLDRRKNNPEVGVVNTITDPAQPQTSWAFDPHLDPSLQFDSGRAALETLIDDALASGDQETMRLALEELKRLQSPYLNWTGKAERTSFAVDTVSLHVHERIDPMSILAAVRKGQRVGATFSRDRGREAAPTSRMVQPGLFEAPFESLPLRDAIDFYRHERGWANRLVAGDSLLVMNSLLQKEGMAGQVQMIYLDPPYGIKYGSNFQPFVGKRDVKDRKDEDLTQEPEMIKAFRDTWELGIHSYLTYLRDRLLLAKDLLSESGSVFVQISDDNVHHVREMCDEIFGMENFVSLICFRKKLMPLGAKTLEQMSDFLVWYGKDVKKIKYKHLYRETTPDPKGRWTGVRDEQLHLRRLDKTYRQELKQGRVPEGIFGTVSQWAPSYSEANDFSFSFKGVEFRPSNGQCWVTSSDKMDRLTKANRLFVEGDSPRFVILHKDFPCSKLTAPWDDTAPAQDKSYVVQTNEQVIGRCLLMTTDPGDLVFDPTCGSGTTAYVAEKWGRRWITCDTSRVAVTLAKQRLMTASYDYFELRYPHEGLKGGFIYKTVPHVTLKSIANNPEIDEIYERMHPAVELALGNLNTVLVDSGISVGAKQGSSASPAVDLRGNKGKAGEAFALPLHEWTIPFDFPADWLETARDPFDAFHKARQAMQKQMDFSIASHADSEILYDQPQADKKKLRITGPFTVEAVPFPTVLALDEAEQPQAADVTIARSGESSRQHQWRDELLKTGIRGKGGQMLWIGELETLPGTRYLHASGHLRDTGERVVVSFGPEYAALEQRQVEMALREAGELFPLPKMIVFCAFNFDPEAAKDIDQLKGITALKAQMNTDLLTEDLKKARSSNQSFWLMGQPDVEVRKIPPNPPLTKGGDELASRGDLWQVEVHGFDYFDTSKGELVSGGKGKIAMWLLDTDYDERSLFPRQVFFPLAGKGEGWQKLKKDIRAELNDELLEQFHGTVSLPFEAGDNRKVAVKIVDDRGIESLKIILLED